MDRRNNQSDLDREGVDRTQESNWDPILGYHMYFPHEESIDEDLKERNEAAQKTNTGDWGDDSDYEELRHKKSSDMNISTFGNEDTKTD